MWPGRPERAAFAGRREIMDALASGQVRPGGTHNASPLCATAALVTLRELGDPTVVQRIDDTGRQMMEAARKAAHDHGIPCSVQGVGAMFQTVWFVSAAVTDDDLAATRTAVTEAFKTLRPEAPPAERGGEEVAGPPQGKGPRHVIPAPLSRYPSDPFAGCPTTALHFRRARTRTAPRDHQTADRAFRSSGTR
ncbi:aminotransferase class III-fold pyridoxal phosphate-dependent enzyme [Streptomyces sp. NPDC059477]|uniref:aminotransferase class III-fold pyridoxal phosphate-dependent enzyme n=1 Tax=Streptomyces sp. NPDC059477 TaxID=3346847 RepID=UPI003676B805